MHQGKSMQAIICDILMECGVSLAGIRTYTHNVHFPIDSQYLELSITKDTPVVPAGIYS